MFASADRVDQAEEFGQPAFARGTAGGTVAGVFNLGIGHAGRLNAVIGVEIGQTDDPGHLHPFLALAQQQALFPFDQRGAIGAHLDDGNR